MDKSIDFITSNIVNNSTIVVAVSGGPDSIVLLNILNNLKEKYNYKIVCAHVNHKLRQESEEEEIFVKNICINNNIIFEKIDFDTYITTNIESEAHDRRYTFFEEIIKKYNSNYLLTAHHGDDLVETILMKLTRGSSLDGYIGFNKISNRNNYKIIRPLIFYTKEEILKYADDNNIEYRIDKTNFDKKITRNRYRLNILPLLKKENNNIHLKYLKFSEELEENNEFIREYINERYYIIIKENVINIKELVNEKTFIIKKIIYKFLLENYKNEIKLINDKHIDSIFNLVSNKKSGFISLPSNKQIYVSSESIYFINDKNKESYKLLLTEEMIDIPYGKIGIIKDTNLTNNYVTHLDSNNIKLPLYVRNIKDNDFIEVLNLNGTKKVKDVLKDCKVDKDKRDNYPVVIDSNNKIIFIPGLKKSKYDTLKQGKYDIIVWYNKEENK